MVVSYGSPEDAPIYQPPTRIVVVGTATMPAIGTPGTFHTSMGTGAPFSIDAYALALARAILNADPNLNGSAIVVVRTRSGVSATAARSSLQRIADAANKVLANDRNPGAYGDSVVVSGVQRPAEIVNYQSTGTSPGILATGPASVPWSPSDSRSALRSVGDDATSPCSRPSASRGVNWLSTIAWQVSVAAVVGIVLGVPTGIALGRWLWNLFARATYAIPLPTVPTSQVILVALGALVLANLVAAVPGQMAARTPTALVLRAE